MILRNAAFVLDCATTMTWLFPDETTTSSLALLNRLTTESAIVPALWPLEVANVILNGEKKKGRITRVDADEFIMLLYGLQIVIEEDTEHRAWNEVLRLAREQSLTVYDAAYLELALRLGLPLATLDNELIRAATALGVALL